MRSSGGSTRSTAEAQRARLTSAAIRVFAQTGFHATPVAEVASAAGVSPAYVFRLFDGKLGLFLAAVDATYSRVAETLAKAGRECPTSDPTTRLEAMTAAYVDLIKDEDLIMMQAHGQSASNVPEIRRAVQDGLGEVVRSVSAVSGASPEAVQRFMAFGQLCHLIVQTDLAGVRAPWAAILTANIRHNA